MGASGGWRHANEEGGHQEDYRGSGPLDEQAPSGGQEHEERISPPGHWRQLGLAATESLNRCSSGFQAGFMWLPRSSSILGASWPQPGGPGPGETKCSRLPPDEGKTP